MRGRVARVLLKLSREERSVKTGNHRVIPRPLTKDIAGMAGTSRETVSRILSEFSQRGLIGLTKENIIIFEGLEVNCDIG